MLQSKYLFVNETCWFVQIFFHYVFFIFTNRSQPKKIIFVSSKFIKHLSFPLKYQIKRLPINILKNIGYFELYQIAIPFV